MWFQQAVVPADHVLTNGKGAQSIVSRDRLRVSPGLNGSGFALQVFKASLFTSGYSILAIELKKVMEQ